MARMVIHVSGQCQKHHGALQLGEIARGLLQFSVIHHLTTPKTTSIPADHPAPAPPLPDDWFPT